MTRTHETKEPRRTPSPGSRPAVEWPTVVVAAAIYGGFGLTTWLAPALPWYVVLPLGAYLVAWHGSLQHEVIHGHPTRHAWLNELFVFPALGLWLPFRFYRECHLRHHRDHLLTDPLEDPESFYVTAAQWRSAGPLGRALLVAHNSLAGRLLLGPPRALIRLVRQETPRLLRGERAALDAWSRHALGCALVLGWTIGVCGLSLLDYVLLFAFPGLSLTLLRSYAEHRPDPSPERRTALVEAHPLWALLYLNNNLHAVHHARPGLPWYRLPALYRRQRDHWRARSGDYLLPGYAAIAARHLLRPRDLPLHPVERGGTAAPAGAHPMVGPNVPASPAE